MGERRKSRWSEAGAAGGSAGLSGAATGLALCCYGPWTVALFGVTGAAAIARFEPYRPFVLGAAGLLLAWAFWRVYRRSPRGLWVQVALWTSLGLLALSFVAQDLALLFVGFEPIGGGR